MLFSLPRDALIYSVVKLRSCVILIDTFVENVLLGIIICSTELLGKVGGVDDFLVSFFA